LKDQYGDPTGNAVQRIIDNVRQINGKDREPIVIAIDGRSGVGKSTLSAALAAHFSGVVIESDDFFSGGADADWAQRSPNEKVDLCINWRRLRAEAIEPLRAGRTAIWHPFNFATGVGLADHTVSRDPASLIILDGIYTARPELADLVDLAVLVEMADDLRRRQRLLAREGGPFMTSWHAIWDDAEDYYFTSVRPPESFDLLVCGD